MLEVLEAILWLVILGAVVVLVVVVPKIFKRDDDTHSFPFGWLDGDWWDDDGNGNGD